MSDRDDNDKKNKKTQQLSSFDFDQTPDAKQSEDESSQEDFDWRELANTTNPFAEDDAIDSIADTAVLSQDNPVLRRALHQQSSSGPNGTTTLGEKREVILLVRGMVERLVITEGTAFKLGRFDLSSKRNDEVDLTPYGAMDRGVSRVHAQLHIESDNLYITDLNSTNGTYLSGERLKPHEPTMLRKGAELMLGRLAIQVLFR